MTPFAQFVLCDAILLTLIVATGIWLFKTAPAPIWLKVALALSLAALVCWSPLATRAILGYPQPESMAELPDRFQLFAEHTADDVSFDLWIGTAEQASPLAVTVIPNKAMRSVLRQAQQKLGQGEPVFISRTPSKPSDGGHGSASGVGQAHAGSARTDSSDDGARWTLNVPAGLPAKDGEPK